MYNFFVGLSMIVSFISGWAIVEMAKKGTDSKFGENFAAILGLYLVCVMPTVLYLAKNQ
jgi:hypothetical protein